jgi:hypothetical protein
MSSQLSRKRGPFMSIYCASPTFVYPKAYILLRIIQCIVLACRSYRSFGIDTLASFSGFVTGLPCADASIPALFHPVTLLPHFPPIPHDKNPGLTFDNNGHFFIRLQPACVYF